MIRRQIPVLRNDFESHAIWEQIDLAFSWLDKIEAKPAAEERPKLQRIRFLLNYAASFRQLAPTHSEMFNAGLLDPSYQSVAQVTSYLQQRASGASQYRAYTDHAVGAAEALLPAVGIWPRPYAKGAQVRQMTTLFQDLLAAQEREISTLESKSADVSAEMDILLSRFETRSTEVEIALEAFRVDGQEVAKTVDEQKSRVDDVVQKGLERVSDLQVKNSEAFDAWRGERQGEWETFAIAQKNAMDKAIDNAARSLKKLKDDEKEFANISSAIGGAKLAGEFDKEAKSSKKLGLWLYGLGFAILAAAAAPLVWLLIWPPTYQASEGPWQHFLIRVSLGALGASAATVLIRLGSRFLTGATASQRMALELQTFGPFLANVKDKDTVDGARLELVDRAFGKSYVPTDSASKDDAVPVTAFAHILDLVKAIK